MSEEKKQGQLAMPKAALVNKGEAGAASDANSDAVDDEAEKAFFQRLHIQGYYEFVFLRPTATILKVHAKGSISAPPQKRLKLAQKTTPEPPGQEEGSKRA